ncbi:MAG: magnesium protoporphyrin IX methyltransferase [Methylocystis sp.]
MTTPTYIARRGELEAYFDRTASEAWKRLTSDSPVGRVRATVRAGREEMRRKLLSWLPEDLRGARLLDAGCGTGALALEVARRGAHVVAVDVSASLVAHAAERLPRELNGGRIEFIVGDLRDPAFGGFDYVVAMDSLIHYEGADIVGTLGALAQRVSEGMVFTIAPRTPALSVMHAVGQWFPRGNRSPAIAPVSQRRLERLFEAEETLRGWGLIQTYRVARGFYISQAWEARRS